VYKPASNAVGLYQMIDAAYAEAARCYIRQSAFLSAPAETLGRTYLSASRTSHFSETLMGLKRAVRLRVMYDDREAHGRKPFRGFLDRDKVPFDSTRHALSAQFAWICWLAPALPSCAE
jgi:hypothetical protein